MYKRRFHIIATLVAVILSATLHAAHSNAERLSELEPLLKYSQPYSQRVPTDSIIAWEKLLAPELENRQQYALLFQINLLTVQALLAEGNTSLAINKANLMYQKAKEMAYPLGTSLALRAMGNTYLSSSTPEAAFESYKDALAIASSLSGSTPFVKATLSQLILMKLRYHRMEDIEEDIKKFDYLAGKGDDIQDKFLFLYCHAYYNIQTGRLSEALNYLQQAESADSKYEYPYYQIMIKYLYSNYFIATKEYTCALDIIDNILTEMHESDSYRYLQILKERAVILTLMGNDQEACRAYDSLHVFKDSLDAKSYIRQINELHTLYQIDKRELDSLNRRQTILHWSRTTIFIAVILIVFFIFLIKRGNIRLTQSQEELEKARKQEENSILTKSIFLSNMSHEIRTPLNALSGFSAILTEESIDNATRQQCSEIIQQNSELLLKLINDVIDLSSLEIGKMKFKYEECDAVTLCRNVIDMVEKIKQTQANVCFSTPLGSLKLTTDNARLQQVLINLLINATKFTRQGTITLTLEKQTDDEALFSVTDTGCGITLENQDKIFNRFEKLNENAQGTGLGLSICQLIIEQLGGRIWIDPDYDKGARFLFTHPLRQPHNRKEETA